MVEKIIINPEEIRGYGNIIIPHVTSDYDVVNASLESGTDTVNGQSMTVYELEYAPNLTNTVLSLSVSQSSVYVYDNVVFTAVLEDEDDNPISGATVTFKEGDTVLGTDTTDNTGEASLTLSTLTVGSHSVTANYSGDSTYASSTSSSVSVTVSHSYSLSFSSSSYVATGGSATLECTLLDNNVPVEGATISVSGSDSSLYTGITNSSGIASVTVSNISAETTFTASYSGATTTCTVTVQSYLFYDEGSSAGLSNYSAFPDWGGNGNAPFNLTYDSTEGAYYCSSESWNMIPSLTGTTTNFKLSVDVKRTVSNGWGALAFAQKVGTGFFYGEYGTNWRGHYYQNKSWRGGLSTTGSSSMNVWYHLELIKNGTSITINCYDSTGNTLLATVNRTYTDDTNMYAIGMSGYFKNIIAESL